MIREVLTLEQLREMGADEAASHLLARRVDGLTAQEEALLAAWLDADEAHGRALERADRAWSIFDDAAGNELLEAMREHAIARRPQRRADWRRIAAIAAAVLLVVGAGWLFVPDAVKQGPTAADTLHYVADRGSVREFVLPDGSRLTLDADSSADGRFDTATRSIELLRGKAYFAVKSDSARPFTVEANGQLVTAVGTAFAVDLVGNALTVTLVEGRVKIGPPGNAPSLATLEPGEQFVMRGGEASVLTLGDQVEEKTDWRVGLMHFDDATLASAVAEANRYSSRQIVVRDPQVAAMRVSGQFRAGDAERFATTIADLHPVRVLRSGNTLELVPAK